MKTHSSKPNSLYGRLKKAFTLSEVVISMSLGVMGVSAIIYGYLVSANRAEWSAYSLAAQSLAQQGIEQARSCKWDPDAVPPVDELQPGNFPPRVNILDIPVVGTNITYATNFVTITTVRSSPPLRCIRVDCIWAFPRRGLFTNTVITYRSPDT